MKRNCVIGILMMGLSGICLSGCGKNDDRSVLFGEDTEDALSSDSADTYPVINEDSRQIVEWKLPYDVEVGEVADTFMILSQSEADDFEDVVIDKLKNSEYCGKSMEYYSISSVEYYITKDICSDDFLDWIAKDDPYVYNSLTDGSETLGYLNVVSVPTQKETVLTMPWTAQDIGGYTGEFFYNLYAGDEISFRYIPNDEIDKAEWIEASVTIDRVTVDTPWYLNEAQYRPYPILLLSWEEFTAMEENPRKPAYVFLDVGENHELHELAKSLRKEYTGKDVNNPEMGVFENQWYFQ